MKQMGRAVINNTLAIRDLSVEVNNINLLNDRTLRNLRRLKEAATNDDIYQSIRQAHAHTLSNRAQDKKALKVPAAKASLKWEDMVNDYYEAPTVEPEVRSIRDDVHHFRAIGLVTTSTGHVHLHIPYNFSEFLQHALMCCECYTALVNDMRAATNNTSLLVHPSLLKGQLNLPVFQFACAEAKSDIFDLMQMFKFNIESSTYEQKGHELYRKHMDKKSKGERNKRQLISGAAIALGTVAAGVAGFSLHSFFSSNPADQNSQIVHKLAAHSHDLQLVVEHEQLLGNAINGLRFDTATMARAEQKAYFAHKIDVCQIQSMVMRTHMNKVLHALRVLYKHELPYEFLNLHTFEENLPELEAALYKRKLRLISNKPYDVFNLKTSWATQKGQLSIFIHVPVSPIRPLPLYKFLPTPFYSTTLKDHYIYDIEDSYLAYSNETMAFRAFPDLTDCTEVHNGLFTCIGHNVLSTNHSTSCLMAIYNGNAEVAYKLCKIKKFLEPSKTFQLGPNNFAFFSRTPAVGNYECVGSKRYKTNDRLTGILKQRHMDAGVSIIQVPNHCSFHTSGLVINSEEITMTAPLLSMPIAPQFQDTLAWAHILDSHKMAELARKDPSFPIEEDIDLTKMNLPEDDLEPITTPWYRHPSMKGYMWVFLIVGIGIFVACGICAYLRWARVVHPEPSTTINVNAPNAPGPNAPAPPAPIPVARPNRPPSPAIPAMPLLFPFEGLAPSPPLPRHVPANHGLGRGSRPREDRGVGRGQNRRRRDSDRRGSGEYDQARHLSRDSETRAIVRDYVDREITARLPVESSRRVRQGGRSTRDDKGEYMELVAAPKPKATPRTTAKHEADVHCNEYVAPDTPPEVPPKTGPIYVQDELKM